MLLQRLYHRYHKPQISIVIPVYNVRDYLAECLDSTIRQTFRDIEIICIDDGSTDDSPEILRHYCKQDTRIRCIRQENQGISVARNTGVAAARGRYIYFLDSDDYIVPEAMERAYARMEADQLDMLLFNIQPFIDSVGEPDAYTQQKYEDELRYFRRHNDYPDIYEGLPLMQEMLQHYDFTAPVYGYMLRADFIRTYDIEFFPKIVHEDELYTSLCLTAAKRVGYIPDALDMRRLRAGSIMTTETKFRNFRSVYICYREYRHYLIEHDLYDHPSARYRMRYLEKLMTGKFKHLSEKDQAKLQKVKDPTRSRMAKILRRNGIDIDLQ